MNYNNFGDILQRGFCSQNELVTLIMFTLLSARDSFFRLNIKGFLQLSERDRERNERKKEVASSTNVN